MLTYYVVLLVASRYKRNIFQKVKPDGIQIHETSDVRDVTEQCTLLIDLSETAMPDMFFTVSIICATRHL